jgi:hypothetical protein
VNDRSQSGFTLLELLVGMCFVAPIGSALSAAKYAKAGLGGYSLTIAACLILSGGGAWAMWWALGVIGKNADRWSKAREKWFGVTVLVASFVWICLVTAFSSWAASTLLKLI